MLTISATRSRPTPASKAGSAAIFPAFRRPRPPRSPTWNQGAVERMSETGSQPLSKTRISEDGVQMTIGEARREVAELLSKARGPSRGNFEALLKKWTGPGHYVSKAEGSKPVGAYFTAQVDEQVRKIFKVDVGGKDRPGQGLNDNGAVVLLFGGRHPLHEWAPPQRIKDYRLQMSEFPLENETKSHPWAALGKIDVDRFVQVQQEFVKN